MWKIPPGRLGWLAGCFVTRGQCVCVCGGGVAPCTKAGSGLCRENFLQAACCARGHRCSFRGRAGASSGGASLQGISWATSLGRGPPARAGPAEPAVALRGRGRWASRLPREKSPCPLDPPPWALAAPVQSSAGSPLGGLASSRLPPGPWSLCSRVSTGRLLWGRQSCLARRRAVPGLLLSAGLHLTLPQKPRGAGLWGEPAVPPLPLLACLPACHVPEGRTWVAHSLCPGELWAPLPPPLDPDAPGQLSGHRSSPWSLRRETPWPAGPSWLLPPWSPRLGSRCCCRLGSPPPKK